MNSLYDTFSHENLPVNVSILYGQFDPILFALRCLVLYSKDASLNMNAYYDALPPVPIELEDFVLSYFRLV